MTFICQHCHAASSVHHKRAGNSDAWAIGKQQHNGFHVRRVVWGLLMAQTEKRLDEEIRKAVIMVEREFKKRDAVAPELQDER